MNTVIKLPWIDDDEYLDFLQSYQEFQFFSKKYQNHPLIENFSKSKAVLLIYCSNKLENTLPTAAKQGDTHKLLCDILHDIDANINYIPHGMLMVVEITVKSKCFNICMPINI